MGTFGTFLWCLALFVAGVGIERWKRWKKLSAFASSNGCKPPQKHLHNPWWLPLGLDKYRLPDPVFEPRPDTPRMFPTLKADRAGRLPAFMLQEFEKHGHTYTQRVTGQLVVLTRSPANIQAICKTRFKDYEIGSDRAGNFRALIGHGILALDGREWTRSRAMLRPHFTRNFDQDFVQLETHVQHLLRRLHDAACKDTPVDVGDLLLKLSTDFATEAVFGHSTNSLLFDLKHWSGEQDKGSAGEFSTAVDYALQMLGQRGQLINFYWVRDSPRFRRSCRTCRAFVNRYLTDARQSQAEKRVGDLGERSSTSFMHSLVARANIPADVIRDQLLALLLASRDTSASFTSWVIYALARDTKVMAKLRGLIDTNFPRGQLPTGVEVASLPYLRHVLNETLRVFPVVPLDGRTAKVDTILPEGGGPEGKNPLLIPAGTKVAFNIYALHHRRDVFGKDADEFRPERWEEVSAGAMGDFEGAFMPFILGPRVCLGKNMAIMTVSYVIVRILQTFEYLEAVNAPASQILPRDPRDWPTEETRYDMEDGETTFSIGVTMSPRDGVWVKLRPAREGARVK